MPALASSLDAPQVPAYSRFMRGIPQPPPKPLPASTSCPPHPVHPSSGAGRKRASGAAVLGALGLLLGVLGCAPRSPSREPAASADLLDAATWSACYRGFEPHGIPRADLIRLTHACGALGGMQPLTPIALQYQAEGDPAHHYALDVPPGGGCYRVYATGDAHVTDLDLLISDTAGPITGDASPDPWPVLPPQGPLCLDAPGRYLLEVSVAQGAGYYALQLWGTPARGP